MSYLLDLLLSQDDKQKVLSEMEISKEEMLSLLKPIEKFSVVEHTCKSNEHNFNTIITVDNVNFMHRFPYVDIEDVRVFYQAEISQEIRDKAFKEYLASYLIEEIVNS